MLNCTDVLCMLHRHEHEHVQSRLQDHRAHHEHHVQVMSGDAINVPDINDQIIKNYFNGTTDTELSSLSHLDDPNEGMYILCGVLIAMLFVAVIIVLLAVTISKLRKREDSAVTNNNTATANNNNNTTNNSTTVVEQQVRTPPPAPQSVDPPPFLWRYSNASSQIGLCNNDQLQTNIMLPTEETGDCKGFRKNLRGKWRRLVKKKPSPEVYTIPAEFKDQLKQIYVY